MGLEPGSILGGYRISGLIGEGGMGAVYRAHDSRLGRDVAIKIPRPELGPDPDCLARFDREARLLASLNHPHIATVFGFEQANDVRFLVMELVAGPTLSHRLSEGSLPLDEALTLAGQIAAAIEAAHDRGIIHRDLKPSNIALPPGSGAKVLDFGLAKALTGDSAAGAIGGERTLTSGGTAEGVILGTAAFMSPEQARGKPVDKRVDVWAFGCVLFDMLTGRSPFAGATLPDTIANILTRDPDWGALPEGVPASIRRLLRRCLEKDLGRRLRDMGDARLEIDDALARRDDAGAAGHSAAAKRSYVFRSLHLLGWGALGALALAALAGLLYRPAPAEDPLPVRFAVTLPESQRLGSLDFPALAISPSGTHIAYVATAGGPPQVFVRSLLELEASALPGTEGAHGPLFSPDGQWIGFFADGKLKKIPIQGGPVRELANAPIGFGATWSADQAIIFAPANATGLWQAPGDEGPAVRVTDLNAGRGEFSHRWPELLPGGRAVLFTSGAEGSWDDAEIIVQPLDGGERRVLVRGGNSPRFVPGGYLAYARAGSIFVVPIDETQWRLAGDTVKVVDGVAHSVDGAAQYSISQTGTLVYIPEAAHITARRLVWVDREGAIQPLPAPVRPYASPRLNPDGRRVALVVGGERDEIWTYDIASNALARLTYEGGFSPTWTVDGSRIVFSASRGGPADLFWRRLDAGADERLNRSARVEVPHSTSSQWLAFVEYDATTSRDISLLALDDRRIVPFLATEANETAPAFSPDGKWIAYVSDSEGRNEVWVAPADDPSRRMRVSNDGGTEPVWARRDGGELFYRAGDQLMSAVIRPGLAVQSPQRLFQGTFQVGVDGRPGYDVSADGARFLMVAAEHQATPRTLHVVLQWGSAVRQR